MKKILFNIDETERNRILEMHHNAIKKNLLKEQDDNQEANQEDDETSEETPLDTTTGSTIGGVMIPGFLFAEEDSAWLSANKGKDTQKSYNDENYKRLTRYYGATLPLVGNSLDPKIFIGKYAIMFNSVPKENLLTFQKDNVVNTTFKVGKIYKNPDGSFIFVTTGGVSNQGLNIRVPQKSTTAYKNSFNLYNGNMKISNVMNPYMGLFGWIDVNKVQTL